MFSLLYMRSAPDDLTARARIRDAAIGAFARDGFDATSMRTIAAQAGVSAALIVHHFGDKNALRTECDEHVVSVFIDEEHDLIEAPTGDRIRAALQDLDRYGTYVDYLSRMLVDGSPAADRLFDSFLGSTRSMLAEQSEAGMLEPLSDPEMTTLLVTLIGLGPVVMRSQIARALGTDQLSPAGLLRLTLPTLELLTHGIYSTTALLDSARDALTPQGNASEGDES
ncbi:TetR family transcriptional regulator [Microbacterium phyllosphaerae]